MNEKAINSIIDNLCDKFGVVYSELVPEMQHYMIVKNLTLICIAALLMLVSAFLIMRCYKANKNNDYDSIFYDSDTEVMIYIFGGVLFIGSLVFLLCDIYELAIWTASPRMALIEHVLNKIGG